MPEQRPPAVPEEVVDPRGAPAGPDAWYPDPPWYGDDRPYQAPDARPAQSPRPVRNPRPAQSPRSAQNTRNDPDPWPGDGPEDDPPAWGYRPPSG